ncbi:hypothetical protein Golob_011992 [Gossypium lobatum]|uniref:Thaumatin-like protein n=1 Tax=Gossypium lobatum TaxID=34289 RepID=A0A7J8MR85_9ROSI|nr:hypothetical protein [Gossypium lobatum]
MHKCQRQVPMSNRRLRLWSDSMQRRRWDPSVTPAEFTLAPNNGKDFFDISLFDGFNLPVLVAPQSADGSGNCIPVSCTDNVNAVFPNELQVKGSDGGVIACNSACLAFNQSQYCCTGSFGTL